MATKKTTKTTTRKKNGSKVTKVTTIIEETVETPAAKPQLTTHLLICLDDSGSMAHCYTEAVKQVNENIRVAREKSRETNMNTTVSFYLFGSRVECVFRRKPIAEVPLIGEQFNMGGSTRLLDAACGAIQDGLGFTDANDPNTSFLTLVVTDGGENASRTFGRSQMVDLLKRTLDTGRWTNVFMVPKGNKAEMASWGASPDNILEWENSRKGTEAAFSMTNAATSNYIGLRSAGMKSTLKFFVETDLSKLSKAEIQKKLTDISSRFKAVQVEREADIKTFAEEKTKKPYVLGSVFYALTKKEKVQPTKEVLIVEKGKKSVWGGPEARDLIGLPQGQQATVTPGNHAQYDIYVKSTSVNRKLVRGTKILIDTTKVVPDAETWDSAAAKAAADAKALAAQQSQTT